MGNFGFQQIAGVYELWTTLHARGLAESHDISAHQLIGRVAILEMMPLVIARALRQLPGDVKLQTVDTLHIASCNCLMDNYQPAITRQLKSKNDRDRNCHGYSAF